MTSPGQRPGEATSPAAKRARARLAADARWLQACGGIAPLAAFLEAVGVRWGASRVREALARKDELTDWADEFAEAARTAFERSRR